MQIIKLILILIGFLATIALFSGFVKPDSVIFWRKEENKTKKTVFKYYGAILIACFILTSLIEEPKVSTQTTNVTTPTTTTKVTQAESKQDTYIKLLESGKTYEEMSVSERTGTAEMLQTWDKLDDSFKTKYKNQKDSLQKNMNDAVAKWKTEREEKETQAAAQKAADEAKKKEENRASYDTGITYDQLARTPDDYKYKKAKFTGKVVQVLEDSGQTDLRLAVNGNYDNMLYVSYVSSIVKSRVLENDNITVRGVSYGIYSYKSTLGGKISIPLLMADEITINDK